MRGTGAGRAAAAVALGLAAVSCGPATLPELPPSLVPEPRPEEVERVVYLVGDGGDGRYHTHPVFPAMQADVERWAEALGQAEGDTAVVVLNLGDIIYPKGVHSPENPQFTTDSIYLHGQARIVDTPAARAHARQYFITGNHDWGGQEDWEGRERLRNLDELLDAHAAEGLPVSMRPHPGDGGPYVVDLGQHIRLLLIESAWWILDAEPSQKSAFVQALREAVRGAGDRLVIMAAHHTYQSAGPHGGTIKFSDGFGIRYILARSGAIVQDLNSRPYRRLRNAILAAGREEGPIFMFAGGHDHSLQVVEGTKEGEPRYSVVSGSASKLTEAGHIPGMLMRATRPGYMRLFVLRDGGVVLSVEATGEDYLSCEEGVEQDEVAVTRSEAPVTVPAPVTEEDEADDESERAACMREGLAAYETIWSKRLR